MTNLPDVSVLLALLWETHEFNERVTRWQENKSLAVRCVAETEAKRLLELLQKYQDQQMDFADACLVRMSELERDAVVFTIDRSDFRVYRRNGNEPMACVFPRRNLMKTILKAAIRPARISSGRRRCLAAPVPPQEISRLVFATPPWHCRGGFLA